MYKCTECGMEYEIKPDYCDCGNDEFVITVEEKKKEEIKQEPEKANAETFISKEKSKTTATERYRPKLELLKIDVISLIIFLICIILSFVIAFIPIKTDESTDNGQTTETKTIKNIPSIDKLWNNAVPAYTKAEPVPEPVEVKKVTPIKQVTKPVQTQKTTPKTTPKATSKQTSVIPQKSTKTQTTVQTNKTEEEKRLEAQRKAEENAKKLAEVKKEAEDLQKSMSDRMELANYKTNLRNTIGRKIDFTRVVGDGDCAISFKIDVNGRLVNGAFIKQSTNMTLNDAVYNAFMSSRNFTAPPSAYKNETLKLHVKFYNGNFEIQLN